MSTLDIGEPKSSGSSDACLIDVVRYKRLKVQAATELYFRSLGGFSRIGTTASA